MARTTAKERLARREHALALLADGNSFRTVAALVSGKYGVSERTAQRDLSWARNRLVGELSSTEVKELLAWFCHRTQTIVQKAEAAGAYGAAVSGMNLIYQAVLSRELDHIATSRERRIGPAAVAERGCHELQRLISPSRGSAPKFQNYI